MRAREALLGVVGPGNVRRQTSGAMLASLPSLSPSNGKQPSTSNDSRADMEFSADSGGSSESSTMSDGDSVNINNSSQHLLRMTSGASMTETDVEDKGRVRGSTLEENEGENEVDEDVNIRPESPARLSEDLETHSVRIYIYFFVVKGDPLTCIFQRSWITEISHSVYPAVIVALSVLTAVDSP